MMLFAVLASLFILPWSLVAGDFSHTSTGWTSSGPGILTLKDDSPLVVAGSRFKPGESVVVRGLVGSKTVRASARGTFVVSFRAVSRCSSFSLVARGSSGTTAALQFSELLCHEAPPMQGPQPVQP